MKEEIINWGENSSLVGILTEGALTSSAVDVGVIFLNAGLIHKIGPNRLYVTLARDLAANGVTCFRYDASSIGDSPLSSKADNFERIKKDEVVQALDAVQRRTGIKRYVLMGICTGADLAFNVSHQDERIVGLSLVDGTFLPQQSFGYVYSKAKTNNTIRYYKKHLFSFSRWGKIVRGKSGVISKKSILLAISICMSFFHRRKKNMGSNTLKTELIQSPDLYDVSRWESILNRNVRIHLIYCQGSISFDIFKLTLFKEFNARNINNSIHLQFIKDVDHTFTPVWSQQFLKNLITGLITKDYNSKELV